MDNFASDTTFEQRVMQKPETPLQASPWANDELGTALWEHSTDGLFIVDTADKLRRVNTRFCDLLGYNPEEAQQLALADVVHPEDMARLLKPQNSNLFDSVHPGCLLKRKSEEYLEAELRFFPLSNGLNIGIVTSRSETEGMENRLYESEERFRLMAESSLTGIYLIQEGRFSYINRAFAEMFGYSVNEVLHTLQMTDLIQPEDRDLVLENIRRRVDGEKKSVRYTFRGRRKDAATIYVEVHGSRIHYKGKPGVIGSLIDITDRVLLEESLKIYRFIFDNASIGIFRVDDDNRIIDVNRHGCQSLGYAKEELLNLSIFDIDPEITRSRISQLRRKVQIAQSATFETTHRKKNGETFPVQIVINSIPYGDQVLRVSFVQDISEREQEREQKEKLELQLRQTQKLEAIGRLAGGVAHDLNNLLTPILGYGELLAFDKSIHGGAKDKLAQMSKAAAGAKDLVKQLLAFSRKQVLEHQPLNLNLVINDFASLIRRTIRENIEIRTLPAPEIQPVMADRGQIEQVVMNLVVNAADAMPDGGLLSIETAVTELDDTSPPLPPDLNPGPYVVLTITDSGIGMDEEVISRIFEPFFSTKGDQGTGLGLATVYGIVKQHNGSIQVESKPGKGSSFKVFLPVTTESDMRKWPKSTIQTDVRGTETILLVEDNEGVRNTVYDILKERGYQVLTAHDGKSALDLLTPDLNLDMLITDVVMPGMNGRELHNRIAAMYPETKVLYMSGYSDDIIDHHGVLKEGIQYIQKPFNSLTLLYKVRAVLDNG